MTNSELRSLRGDSEVSATRWEIDSNGELLRSLYAQLKTVAAAQMAGERPDHTLTATALLNEAFLRMQLSAGGLTTDATRVQLFAAAADTMRQILIEHGRKHARRRKLIRKEFFRDGSSMDPVRLDASDLLAIDDAVSELIRQHPEKGQLVKLRFFAGLTLPEAASAMEISLTTANRYWRYARAWLSRELSHDHDC